ncbi:uncharacterized protein TNCV_181061 [Trichonephila clavipes]|nr:uncharacterized protein TNCV_181061 [Trichonephila clavipes]
MNFVYELLKLQKKALKLEIKEQSLIQHIVNRLEPQVLDYVDVRNPTTRAQLLQARRESPDDRRNRNWRDAEVLDGQNDRRDNYSNTGIGHRGTRGPKTYGDRLNCLRVRVDQNDQSQIEGNPPIMLSALCMSSVELPYVPFLLNETLTKTLWDTVAEKSFISEEAGKSISFYKPVKKSRAEVVTAQGARFQFPRVRHHSKRRHRLVGVRGSTRNGRRDPKCLSARHFHMVREDTGASNEVTTCAWMAADEAAGCTRAFHTMWRSSRRLVCRGRPEPGLRVNDIS